MYELVCPNQCDLAQGHRADPYYIYYQKVGQNHVLFVQKNAALGGALTGAFLSVSDARLSQDKIVRTAITASALAAASEFLKLNLN